MGSMVRGPQMVQGHFPTIYPAFVSARLRFVRLDPWSQMGYSVSSDVLKSSKFDKRRE